MTLQFAIALLLCTGIGFSLGLIGGGGSIITVPLLVYLFHVEPHQAMGMSLAVVGATSLFATGLQHSAGHVHFRTGMVFAAIGVAGAYFGSGLSYLLSPPALMLAFAALMIVVSLLMLRNNSEEHEEEGHRRRAWYLILLAGLGVGVLTGFLGVGGGFLIVPALVFFCGLPIKQAVGTSLLVISLNSAGGLVGHWRHGGFDLRLTALVTLFALAGAVAGVLLSKKTKPRNLSRGFAFFVLAVALFLLVKNLPALF